MPESYLIVDCKNHNVFIAIYPNYLYIILYMIFVFFICLKLIKIWAKFIKN